jgi:hypothetical protein
MIRSTSANRAGLLAAFCLAAWPVFCHAAPAAATAEKREASPPESATVPTNLGMFRGINAIDDNVGKILDLAGQPVPATMQGRSWKPLLENTPGTPWRDSSFYCYFFETNQGTPTTTAVRTADAKLIKYPGHDDWTEMFDLRRDPYETRNLASDPAPAEMRRRLEAEYDKQAAAINFRIPDFADTPPPDGLPAKKKRAAGKRAQPAG